MNLHGRGPQSTALLQASRPHRLVSYGLDDGPVWRADEHEVLRWCRLLDESGIPADPSELAVAPPPEPPPVTGAVLLHPGAAFGSRRWPADRWAAVARALPGPVLVTAGPGEEALARHVAALGGLPAEAVVSGLSLRALTGLVAASRLLLSPDTGVAHLATAVGTPSVVLFGPVAPDLWGPPADRPQHVALWAGTESENASDDPAPGLLALTPDQVLAEALPLLRSGRCRHRRSAQLQRAALRTAAGLAQLRQVHADRDVAPVAQLRHQRGRRPTRAPRGGRPTPR